MTSLFLKTLCWIGELVSTGVKTHALYSANTGSILAHGPPQSQTGDPCAPPGVASSSQVSYWQRIAERSPQVS